jgi:hypothetical protein
MCLIISGMKNMVLREMHNVPYVGHPGYQKTIAACQEPIFLARYEERGG